MHAYFPERFLLTGALSLFYGKDLPFSNFHPVPFILDGIKYSCSEKYMMEKKAVLFQDIKQERDILNSSAPLVMKQVQTFDKYLETIL